MDDSTTDDPAESSDAADGPETGTDDSETSADASVSETETETEAETDAEWMEPADKPILEFLQSEDAFEPNQIDDEGIAPAKYAAYRCREMTKRGLLTKHMPGVYEVSELGERYLEGTLDPSELEADK
ncbi:hypothetical protein CP556_12710 [Natrinema sp. CBA1119]|uniref:hypothetical protein n=1 Tax=Natrinema sp. CBA1119 TaxID=1608465 RepID=UPI000BF9A69F|nr:hypothetical protein [Natrinema sp. CBA1119]PGF16896.1 hypothetical protein CP556_12710 [Natrinema sp. CBA1119]